MSIRFSGGEATLPVHAVAGLVADLSKRLDLRPEDVVRFVGGDPEVLDPTTDVVSISTYWPFARLAYERRLLDLIPAHGLPSINYDLSSDIKLNRNPLGLTADFSQLKLDMRPTNIAGFEVDFPIGVPASILTANSTFLRYYADRGYSILTYKTVRSGFSQGHPYPQWTFLDDATQLIPDESGRLKDDSSFVGRSRYFPADPAQAGMANSFGIPSYGPSWWKEDLHKARGFVRPGHQVLIASVMSSAIERGAENLQPVLDDFVETSRLIKQCGVDIIELNLSCPNTKEPAGDLYHYPADAAAIARAVRAELQGTPIFVKIGYLADEDLSRFFAAVAPFIDGIVATNTIAAWVLAKSDNNDASTTYFPGRGREKAGISGWPIKQAAQRMAGRLAVLRDEYARREGKRLTLLGLGGVMDKRDFNDRLKSGVDAVQICTGSYLDPFLGLEIRNAEGNIQLTYQHDTLEVVPTGTGALARSSTGADERVSNKRSAKMLEASEGNKGVLDPVKAGKLLRSRFKTTDEATRRRLFASFEAKILADMELADDTE